MRTVRDEPFRLTLGSRIGNKVARKASALALVPSLRSYNLTIARNPDFIWFRVAKTGTRTLMAMLEGAGVEFLAEHPMNVHYFPNAYVDYFKFSMVRNPWDRVVSGWHNKIVDRNWYHLDEQQLAELRIFDNFVSYLSRLDLDGCDVHFRRQSRVIDLNNLDYLGRFENFDRSVKEIFSALNLRIDSIPVVNSSDNRKNYRNYYSESAKDIIWKLYRKDVEIFNYQF